MIATLEMLIVAFGTLFAIVNPFSASFVFMKITSAFDDHKRKMIALRASITALIALIVFLFIGQPILDFFGVTVYAFRVAGGIYMGWIAFEMLSPKLRRNPDSYKDNGESDDHVSIAIIPIAIPLLSGPGALTSVLVLASDIPFFIVMASIVLVSLISWIVLHNAAKIQKHLGKIGTSVLERLLGIIVLVVAVQFVFNGISGYLGTI